MNLNSYLYINKRLVDDYISAIEGSVYEEEIVKSRQATTKDANFEGGLFEMGNGGRLSTDEDYLREKRVKVTYAAKTKKIIDYLKDNGELNVIEDFNLDSLNELNRNDFFEVFVKARTSKTQQIISSINLISDMYNSLGDILEVSEDERDSIELIKNLGDFKETIDGGGCQIVFNPDGHLEISLVAQIEKEYLLEPIESINTQCCVLCKFQHKFKDGEEIEIDSLLDGVKGISSYFEIQQDLTNPPELKDVIKAPGAFVLPIAIYQ